MLRSNDDDDDDDNEHKEEGESDTDDQSVFDLTAPNPPQLPRQYSVDLMLETYDWKEMECTHPGCLSLELRREFNRLENTLVPITENRLGTQEYEESLRSYCCISDNTDSNAETSASADIDDEKCRHRSQPKKKNLKRAKLMIGSSSSSSEDE